MGILSKLRRIKSAIKYGGYNEIKISQIEYNECLKGKNIIITGGSSGIGYQIAKKSCLLGASVIITGRNEAKLKEAKNSIDGEIDYLIWDITDQSLLPQMIDEVFQRFEGNVDCLVNNAGLQPHEFFPNVSEEEWNKIYDTKTSSQPSYIPFNHSIRISGYKKIIFIDSQGGFVGATYPYRMVKWDIRGLTRGLGLKLAKDSILVNAIAPGVVRTEMQQFSIEQGDNTYCTQNLLNRVSLPEEVAELACFMMSDSCNFMVGQTILIDGGYSLK